MKKSQLLLLFAVMFVFMGSKNASRDHIAVGIFSDSGAWPTGWDDEYSYLIKDIITSLDPDCKAVLFNSVDLMEGITAKLDVVIFPGGSGDEQSRTMGEEGRNIIRSFIKKGGGFVGICAGAYLAQQSNKTPELSLRISSARLFNNAKYWDRGGAIAEVDLTSLGTSLLPECKKKKTVFFYYYQGPLLVPAEDGQMRYEELIRYKSNIYHKQPQANGESPGKTFLLRENYFQGTVVLMAGHPEFSPGLYWLLPKMVRWAVKKNTISYPDRFTRPVFSKEIMFDKTWMKQKDRFVKDLEKNWSPWSTIKAMRGLRTMGSFEVCKYLSALLKDPSPLVRKEAAVISMYYGFFPLLNDIKKARALERNSWVKKYMQKAETYLTIKKKNKRKQLEHNRKSPLVMKKHGN